MWRVGAREVRRTAAFATRRPVILDGGIETGLERDQAGASARPGMRSPRSAGAQGAQIVGGCCGTSPADIAAARERHVALGEERIMVAYVLEVTRR